jgi:small subunit ribosomal protein S20
LTNSPLYATIYPSNKELRMPRKKSAFKELRKSKKRHLRNIRITSELKSLNKKFTDLLDKKDIEQAQKVLQQLSSKFDKAVIKQVIPRNKASRKKSRLKRGLNKVK